jgi:glucose-6-phosphate isomerase
MVAVTSETSPLAGNEGYIDSFYIDDFIGGRYSSSSAVGGVLLSLAFGPETFAELLAGAHEADRLAQEKDISRNAALLDAMIGLYERNVLGMGETAILPYSEPLSRFPAHLQQLDMESNGKRVDRSGVPLSYATGPIVFGEPGTNGQHSFYQLLHQGTNPVPLQFVGFLEGQTGGDIEVEGSTSRQKLNANLAAQIVAFARGKDDLDTNKEFPGERPSTLIRGGRLDPRALGALLAHYENKVMFQGFAWNINSFDQEGVQLGKILAKKVLSMATDAELVRAEPALAAYAAMLGLPTA